jgi:outer membrane protein assembly factor BamD (BamD/ComL family)
MPNNFRQKPTMMNTKRSLLRALAHTTLALSALAAAPAFAQPAAPASGAASGAAAANAQANEMAATQLLERGQELLTGGETERGLKMIETVYEQYPSSPIRYKAYLALGKHYLAAKDQAKAIGYLRNARTMELPDRSVPENLKDIYLESFYLMGVSNFEKREYAAAFPLLRRITEDFPNTVWANQSYYYIGMCHFAQSNWSKAIEALSMVGTFVAPDSPAVEVVESGRRFYVKVTDGDLPVLTRLGQDVKVTVQAKSGDKETITCIPLPGSTDTFIGSIPTEMGAPKPNDGVIQIVGGDAITTTYVDANTQDGKKDVAKSSTTRVVSTGGVIFTLGDMETPTGSAFAGQPVFVVLQDADLDTTAAADSVKVKLISRVKASPEEIAAASGASGASGAAPAKADADKPAPEGDQYIIHDEATVTLTEVLPAPSGGDSTSAAAAAKAASDKGVVHSGRFTGKVDIAIVRDDKPVEKVDGVLHSRLGDEILVVYNDEVHALGNTPRQAQAMALVISEIENRPRATQYIVDDAVVSAKKNLVEASAFLELAGIFKSLGLIKNAAAKADEGLRRVEPIIRTSGKLPPALVEQAFKTKWELQLVKDDLGAAISTCEMFNRLFPESPFVDQALMGIAEVRLKDKKYPEAIAVFQRVLNLPHSLSKAEAAFKIAQAGEEEVKSKAKAGVPLNAQRSASGGNPMDKVISQYKMVADRYRDSEYAGPALAKMVDYYYDVGDYNQATDLLSQIFQDYPDGSFLDQMLLKWAMVAFKQGDYKKAAEKCQQVIFDYPDSPQAKRAKEVLPKIEALMSKK